MQDALTVGAAREDITPELGIQLAGDIGRYRPVEEIRDRLYANALVLDAGGRRACILSLDLLATSRECADRIRAGAAERLETTPDMVILHVTQNHAAPSLGHCFVSKRSTLMPPEYPWLRGGDDRYNEPTVEKCMAALSRALKRLEPAALDAGRGVDARVAFNRRFVMRDGRVRTHPETCDGDILHAEGPVDPEVGVATFTNADGNVVSAFLHHTCHPTHGYPHRFVIGDWPGRWVEMMRERWGGDSVPLVINGCCGNVHHANHLDPDYSADYRRMAAMLAEATEKAMGRMQPMNADSLRMERSVLRLPLRKLSQREVDDARRFIERYPGPKWLDDARTQVDWDWVYAVGVLDLKETQEIDPFCDYEIQVLRLGGLAIVALMGEPFVEEQLRIKLESPAPYTFVAHFCNGYAGYVPTARAFKGGGYETRTSNGSKFEPGALTAIGDEAITLLGRAFAR